MAASRASGVFSRATPKHVLYSLLNRPKRLSSAAAFLALRVPVAGQCAHYHGNLTVPMWHTRATSSSSSSSSATRPKDHDDGSEHGQRQSNVNDSEKPHHNGSVDEHEFQAETRMLLDIVAKSLYSEKEVFIRELISNASDALEKFRFASLTGDDVTNKDRPLEIHISTDKEKRTFTIQDSGIGMTKEGLRNNLGVIARSGSKIFLREMEKRRGGVVGGGALGNIIGQFGVGFYSAFMVAARVDVFTRDSHDGAKAFHWSSNGAGTYTVAEADDAQTNGTKIVLHLKPESAEFADEDVIKEVIKKYSNFVGSPIHLNGRRANVLQALWLMDPKDVTDEMHEEFFRFVGQSLGSPRYTLHYRTDAPLSLRCLLYVPEGRPGLFEQNAESNVGVSLYTRKVLITHRADSLLPRWLRFVKGVVDSEDIPLNLSRELLQDSALIRRLRTVLTNRFLRFLNDQARKDEAKYDVFFKDYGLFLKEGIVTSVEQLEKEEIGKLLLFESSAKAGGENVSLPDYCGRMKPGQRDIYYLVAPSRHLAETSAYMEALKAKEVEVLFCYEPYDELVLLHLREFDRKLLTSVEKEVRRDKEDLTSSPDDKDALPADETGSLKDWLKQTLRNRIHDVKVTKRLSSHPCVVTIEEMGAARHFLRTQPTSIPAEQRYKLLEPVLEINTSHPIIRKLSSLKSQNPRLAELVAQQIFDNAMVMAGLHEDSRTVLSNMNELLCLALEKH